MTRWMHASGPGTSPGHEGTRRILVLLALGLLLLACRGKDDPETRIRRMVDRAEEAAERRAPHALGAVLSESYLDDRGQDRDAVIAMAAYYLRAHESVHVVTRIDEIDRFAPGQARLVVVAAVAGRQADSFEQLRGLQADVFRFELLLSEEDGQWRVTAGDWQPTSLSALL